MKVPHPLPSQVQFLDETLTVAPLFLLFPTLLPPPYHSYRGREDSNIPVYRGYPYYFLAHFYGYRAMHIFSC